MPENLAPESFKQQVRDCLVHLYDFTALQTNPLAEQIAPDLSGLQRIQMVRRVIMETVEQLKARETVGIPSRQDRIYSLLSMRYIEGLPTQEVLGQMALSERQFYREHQRAIEALSQLLWHRVQTTQPSDHAISVKTEIQRLSSQSSFAIIDLEATLSEAIATNANLAERHRVNLQLRPIQSFDDFLVHQAVLKQTVIWMLSQIITHVTEGSDIALAANRLDESLLITFEFSNAGTNMAMLRETLSQSPTIGEFLAILGGTIRIEESDKSTFLVQFQLERQRQVILVIDDNPDVVALLGRYITGMPYEIVSAFEADEGFRLCYELEPSCIVLDIMLPHTDGWKVLKNLKSQPRTQHIPILVCSALDNPDLALSLGADSFLRKPPDRLSFLEALRYWTALEH
jgi:CheY-like chemotaxis protein